MGFDKLIKNIAKRIIGNKLECELGKVTVVNNDGTVNVNIKGRPFDLEHTPISSIKADFLVGDIVNVVYQNGDRQMPVVIGYGSLGSGSVPGGPGGGGVGWPRLGFDNLGSRCNFHTDVPDTLSVDLNFVNLFNPNSLFYSDGTFLYNEQGAFSIDLLKFSYTFLAFASPFTVLNQILYGFYSDDLHPTTSIALVDASSGRPLSIFPVGITGGHVPIVDEVSNSLLLVQSPALNNLGPSLSMAARSIKLSDGTLKWSSSNLFPGVAAFDVPPNPFGGGIGDIPYLFFNQNQLNSLSGGSVVLRYVSMPDPADPYIDISSQYGGGPARLFITGGVPVFQNLHMSGVSGDSGSIVWDTLLEDKTFYGYREGWAGFNDPSLRENKILILYDRVEYSVSDGGDYPNGLKRPVAVMTQTNVMAAIDASNGAVAWTKDLGSTSNYNFGNVRNPEMLFSPDAVYAVYGKILCTDAFGNAIVSGFGSSNGAYLKGTINSTAVNEYVVIDPNFPIADRPSKLASVKISNGDINWTVEGFAAVAASSGVSKLIVARPGFSHSTEVAVLDVVTGDIILNWKNIPNFSLTSTDLQDLIIIDSKVYLNMLDIHNFTQLVRLV